MCKIPVQHKSTLVQFYNATAGYLFSKTLKMQYRRIRKYPEIAFKILPAGTDNPINESVRTVIINLL